MENTMMGVGTKRAEIDWASFRLLEKASKLSLMAGEVRTLTEDEIFVINNAVRVALENIGNAVDLMGQAQARYKENRQINSRQQFAAKT